MLTNADTKKVSIEDVREGWSDVTSMESATYPESTQQSTMDTLAMIEKSMTAAAEAGSDNPLDAVGYTSEPYAFNYTFKGHGFEFK